MRQKIEVLMLPVTLTPSEITEYGIQLAAERPKEAQLKDQLDEFKKTVNANLVKVNSRINDLSNRINLKKELRPIKCNIVYQFEDCEKVWIRTDTGEIARREPLAPGDYQEEAELESNKTPVAESEEA